MIKAILSVMDQSFVERQPLWWGSSLRREYFLKQQMARGLGCVAIARGKFWQPVPQLVQGRCKGGEGMRG